eukprot:m.180978 g.180978  ORF g.180978 m.180978 type:complete len:258 (+) comp16624_c0_seq5:91-864(+)
MIGVGIILIRVVFVCFLLFFFLVLFFSFPFPSPFSSFFFTPLLSFPSFPPSFLLSVSLFFLYQLFIPHSIHKMATLNAPIAYDKSAYIITHAGNKVHRQSVLGGSQNIILRGKTIVREDCVFRGDLGKIKVGKNCVFDRGVVVHPAYKVFPEKAPSFRFLPLEIGEFVTIGERSVISAARIGSYTSIGKNCIVGRRCILSERCCIEDNTVLPPDTMVPPYAIFAGSPGRQVGTMPEITDKIQTAMATTYYDQFVAAS